MGIVYRAHDTVLDRDVALKLVHPDRADPDVRRRFLEEARIAATLSHPGIAAIYQAGEAAISDNTAPQLYVAQELVEGETLRNLLKRGALSIDRAVDLVGQLLEALGEAHARGVIHRDINPANLMVTHSGRLKVLDFGIARRLIAPAATTRLSDDPPQGARAAGNTVAGTPGYMAPEQLRGIADARSDLFAAGCVLYELLTARQLFQFQIEQIALAPSAALRTLRPEVPEAIGTALDRSVALGPEARYPSAEAFAQALRPREPRGLLPANAEARRGSRLMRRASLAGAGLFAALLAALFAWRWYQPALTFAERDWLLIASVINETSDQVFDSALEAALATDLRQSRYVNVFDEAQLANVLKQIRLPPETRVDVEIGRNIARLAGVRVLLVPKIVDLSGVFQLEASLIEPASGRVVDRLRVTARSREEVLLKGIDEFTRQVRTKLGESLQDIEKTDPILVEFATPSWEALRYVRLAAEALARADVPRAARAFEQALAHDPKFPAALVSLGLLNIELLGKPAEGKRMLTAALEHSKGAPERELFMIRAVHKQFVTGDAAGALEDYRFMSTQYPDMFQPYNNSGRILMELGRVQEAIAMFERAHALDPRHSVPLWNLWELKLNRIRDPQGAQVHARALLALQPDNAWTRHLVAWTDVALREFNLAEQGMKEVRSALPLHPLAPLNLGHLLLRRGAALEAAEVYREALKNIRSKRTSGNPSEVLLFLSLALRQAGQEQEARQLQDEEIARLSVPGLASPRFELPLAALAAAAGRHAVASRLAARSIGASANDPSALYWTARVHALLGEEEQAAALLRRASTAGYSQPYFVLIDPTFRALEGHRVIEEIAPRQKLAHAEQ